MRNRLGLLLVFVFMLHIAVQRVVAQTVQDELVMMLTTVRGQSNLPPLSTSSSLQLAAQRQADYMAASNEVTHRGVDGRFVEGRAAVMGYDGRVGEVIYGGADTSPENALAMWMGSDTHIAIIMNGAHVEVGVGRSEGSDPDWIYWCVVFGTPTEGRIVDPPTIAPLPLPVLVVETNKPTPVPTAVEVQQPAPTIIIPPVVLEPSPTPQPSPTIDVVRASMTATPTDDPVMLASASDVGGDVRDDFEPVVEIREAVIEAVVDDSADPQSPTQSTPAEQELFLDRITPADPVPMIITVSALIAAAVFIYLGYQSPPRKRNDPFRRW